MGDLLDLVLAHDVAERSPASQVSEEKPKGPNAEVRCSFPRFRAMSIKGMVGSGRHGADSDRKLLCFHMRTQKQSRSLHTKLNAVATKLHGSTFKKSGKTFKVHIKQAKKGSGIVLALDSVASKGNRYVRAIAFFQIFGGIIQPKLLQHCSRSPAGSAPFIHPQIAENVCILEHVCTGQVLGTTSSIMPEWSTIGSNEALWTWGTWV